MTRKPPENTCQNFLPKQSRNREFQTPQKILSISPSLLTQSTPARDPHPLPTSFTGLSLVFSGETGSQTTLILFYPPNLCLNCGWIKILKTLFFSVNVIFSLGTMFFFFFFIRWIEKPKTVGRCSFTKCLGHRWDPRDYKRKLQIRWAQPIRAVVYLHITSEIRKKLWCI